VIDYEDDAAQSDRGTADGQPDPEQSRAGGRREPHDHARERE
jgi:hypothetical protein